MNIIFTELQKMVFNYPGILDRCVYCGGYADMFKESDMIRVECTDCKFSLSTATGKTSAVSAFVEWNRLQRRLGAQIAKGSSLS